VNDGVDKIEYGIKKEILKKQHIIILDSKKTKKQKNIGLIFTC